MTKVFIIAYQFPPMGGSGVQRTLKFVKYLPKFNYEPIVFTAKANNTIVDETLEKEGVNGKIIRTKAYTLGGKSKVLKLFGKILGRILIPDPEWIWYIMNRNKALKYVKKYNIKLMYSTSYPYSDHLMGNYIKKKLPNVIWVTDFRDEWTKNPYIEDKRYSYLRKRIEKKMEESVVKGCDYFITNTPLMLKAFLEDYNISGKSYVIPNGYDPEDFEGLDRNYKLKNNKLVITYSGSIYGRRNRIDIFFKALKKAIEKGIISKDKVLVRIIGNYNKKLVNRMKEVFPYENCLEFISYLPHRESIKKLLESDILLLFIGIGKGAEKIYTGKIFEYFYANRPILAMVPKGSVAGEIIKETNTGYNCSNEDPKDIYKILVEIYKKWEKEELKHQPNWNKIKNYDRLNLTKDLSEVFDKAILTKGDS